MQSATQLKIQFEGVGCTWFLKHIGKDSGIDDVTIVVKSIHDYI